MIGAGVTAFSPLFDAAISVAADTCPTGCVADAPPSPSEQLANINALSMTASAVIPNHPRLRFLTRKHPLPKETILDTLFLPAPIFLHYGELSFAAMGFTRKRRSRLQ